MAALREIEVKGGEGLVIDLPLLDPLFSIVATDAVIYGLTGQVRERTEQPLGDGIAAKGVPNKGRALYRDFRVDPGDGRMLVPRDRPR